MRAGVAALGFLCVAAVSALAEDVTLSDGAGFEVSGKFLGFDGEFYRLQTPSGRLVLEGTGFACTGEACPQETELVVGIGVEDSSLRRLFTALLRDYARRMEVEYSEVHGSIGIEEAVVFKRNTGVRLRFQIGRGDAEWMLLRQPEAGPGRGRRDAPIAFDALVPAVAPENPLIGLTYLSIRTAISGEFENWSGLGGESLPVTVHWPRTYDGAFARQYGFDPSSDAARHNSVDAAAGALAADPGGLGLLHLSDIGSAVPLVVTGSCGRGILATADAVRTGDYPLSEFLVLRYPSRRLPPALRDFVGAITSAEASRAVSSAGFLDLGVTPVQSARDGRQEADAVSLSFNGQLNDEAALVELGQARRLNVAMRFQDGSSLPDRFARKQITRLVAAIKAGAFDGKRLRFVGFSDADGAADVNLRLSQRRAETIKAEVLAAVRERSGRVVLEAVGLGEAMPVACNGVDWGERLNRRVEVWVDEP